MYRIRIITHQARELLAAIAAAAWAGLCPQDEDLVRCGVRIGR
jgi:hypothetical protein